MTDLRTFPTRPDDQLSRQRRTRPSANLHPIGRGYEAASMPFEHTGADRTDTVSRIDAPQSAEPGCSYVLLGERHRLQIEALRLILPEAGVGVIDCDGGLRNLTDTLARRPDSGLLLLQPTRGLLTALREQTTLIRSRRILIVTTPAPTRFYLRDVARVRPNGVITPCGVVADLVEAIQAVEDHRTVVGNDLQADLLVAKDGQIELAESNDLLSLTTRQLEVVRLTAIGCSTKDIADRLLLSPKTVESHRYRAMQRLRVHDRVELTRLALASGLLR